LLLVQPEHHFEDVLFESASALGTVGLSRGMTPELTTLGKWIVIALMFVGRVGPLTFGLALFAGGSNPVGDQVDDIAV
jgi:trk system potassium uptake protein TrkH